MSPATTSPVRTASAIVATSGLWLLLAPFLFGYAARAAVFNDVLAGLLIVGFGVGAFSNRLAPHRVQMLLILGLWLLLAPFVLGYADADAPLWSDLVVGAVAVTAGWFVPFAARRRPSDPKEVVRPLLPVAVAVAAGFLIASGLLFSLREGLVVAPRAERAAEGRLLHHMKNVTRLTGDAAAVGRAVWEATYLEDAPAQPAGDWRAQATARLGAADANARHAVVLSSEGETAPLYALPGLYWAMYARIPVVWAGPSGVDAASLGALPRRLPLYVLAPEALVPDDVLDVASLEGVPILRIADDDPVDHALRIAQYHDARTGFGWGRSFDRRNGYFHYVLTTPQEWNAGLAGLPLARSNAATFLWMGEDGNLPAATERYLWKQRAEWMTTPAEGPFRHMWILGDRTSYAAQGRMDLSVEKADYPARGPVALGPMEGLAVVYLALGLCSFLFVLLHAMRVLHEVMAPMRLAWAFTALLVPVLGVVLYLSAYRRPRYEEKGHTRWLRPPAVRAAAATAMGFGYGAPIMIAIGYVLLYFGFPLVYGGTEADPGWLDTWLFVFGAGMPLMMILMYVGAVGIAWPLVQLPMMKSMMPKVSAGHVLRVVAVSMAAVSLGMMVGAWWGLMWRVPMMPVEDDVLWFGLMWFASTTGFLVAWPLNLVMARTGFKMGSM